MIYLASPYSHPDKAVREARYNAVLLCAAACLKRGQPVFSPIVYGHTLVQVEPDLGTAAAQWAEFNTSVLRHCSVMCILTLEGWDTSVGVMAEMAMAKALGIPIFQITPTTPAPNERN